MEEIVKGTFWEQNQSGLRGLWIQVVFPCIQIQVYLFNQDGLCTMK